MPNTTLNLEDVLDHRQIDALADAVAEYLSDVTGHCLESMSIGLEVTYRLDDEDEEGDQ